MFSSSDRVAAKAGLTSTLCRCTVAWYLKPGGASNGVPMFKDRSLIGFGTTSQAVLDLRSAIVVHFSC